MKPLRQAYAVVAVVIACLGAAPPVAAQSRGAIGTAVAAPAALRVDGFDVEQVTGLEPGTPLHFSLYGSAGGNAHLRIDGVPAALPLQEVEAGVYEGTYVVASADRIAPDSRVTASLWRSGRSATVVLDEPLVLGTPQARTCADCAVVEAIRAVDERDAPGYLGAMAGGVIGAILGSQIGKGDGRTAGGLLGAVGGAVVGHEVERRHGQRTRYEVAVRGPDGVLHTRRYDTPPPFRVGDRLRTAGGDWRPVPVAVLP